MAPTTHIKRVTVDGGISVFYREAGSQTAPTILLLHGYPSSSFQYRNLITRLAEKYHVLAPDFPGYGFTVVPAERKYEYTFGNLTKTLGAFVDALKVIKYVIYIFDYGAPIGLRLALERPQAIAAIISQNGNAYVEGLGTFWDTCKKFWENPATERTGFLKMFTSFELVRDQYTVGAPDPSTVPPETYHLDHFLINRPGNPDIQTDIMFDYQNNVTLYPAFQQYFREYSPPTLAAWGKNDPVFIAPGAEALQDRPQMAHWASAWPSDDTGDGHFVLTWGPLPNFQYPHRGSESRSNHVQHKGGQDRLRSPPSVPRMHIPKAEVKLLDAAHFALETHNDEIADLILSFLAKHNI
ncbi:hypothetical protein EIP91_010377 [Steccherinum ochraceum]|uniref:AB hydrolase-1 domain-containing protein n=1 Tax=Steccherinum ochraceum TaxID=92696 RepID=A0A4R0RX06_9APHY|nr:hypothetical protein EIP91_010377 [Steccherinum ochraceum]